MATQIATHEAPTWRDRANFLIFADLTNSGMVGRWEQLWAQQVGSDAFEICCIPFFTYGLALGDVVRTSPSDGRRYVVAEVEKRSGRRVLRLWLKSATAEGRELVNGFLASHSGGHEWSSDNLVAVDVPSSDEAAAGCSALIAGISGTGVDVEWGD